MRRKEITVALPNQPARLSKKIQVRVRLAQDWVEMVGLSPWQKISGKNRTWRQMSATSMITRYPSAARMVEKTHPPSVPLQRLKSRERTRHRRGTLLVFRTLRVSRGTKTIETSSRMRMKQRNINRQSRRTIHRQSASSLWRSLM